MDWAELPAGGVAQAAASGVHSTAAWEFTHVTIFALISLLTELVRLLGKWKKLQIGCVHVLPSYALLQHMRVNLFGLDGWGKIGPGWRSFAEESVASCLRIVFPWDVGVGVGLLSSKPLVFWLPVVELRGIRLLIDGVPFPFALGRLVGDSPAASLCAVRFFVVSGGWKFLKTNDASLYGPAVIVRIVLWRFWRSCVPCIWGCLKMSGEIVPVDKALRYPWRRATATNPATVDVISWKTLNISSFAFRCNSNQRRPSVVRMTLSNSTISVHTVGGLASSMTIMVFMRQ